MIKKHLFLLLIFPQNLLGKDLQTNEFEIFNAPRWVKQVKVEKITDTIQSKLEWSTRRIKVYWHSDIKSFTRAQSLGEKPVAVTIKSKLKTEIHMGPNVTLKNYQKVLGHELVHVIFYQKYHGSIPRWLEEGFANHLSRKKKVDYFWLSKQKMPLDVRAMRHPFKSSMLETRIHYIASQALVEMLKKKCDLDNLLRLSVQKKMESYIKSYCNISDINQEFKAWILSNTSAVNSR